MFLKCALNIKTSIDSNSPDYAIVVEEKRCPGFVRHAMAVSFYFLASLSKSLLVITVLASYTLKLSLPIFLKCFLIFAKFQPHISYQRGRGGQGRKLPQGHKLQGATYHPMLQGMGASYSRPVLIFQS